MEGKANEYDSDLSSVRKSIESMMREYDVLNKRLAQLIGAAGGTELSPHELKVILQIEGRTNDKIIIYFYFLCRLRTWSDR